VRGGVGGGVPERVPFPSLQLQEKDKEGFNTVYSNNWLWLLGAVLGTIIAMMERREAEASSAEPFDFKKYGFDVPPTPETPLDPYPTISLGPKGESSLFQFSATDADGKAINLKKYEGKVCIVVNIALDTPYSDLHFIQLQDLYERYKSQGLVILAFPYYEFHHRGRRTMSDRELRALLRKKYGVSFPVFRTVQNVNRGEDADPLFYYCRHQLPGANWYGSWNIAWDFTKFLFDHRSL